MDKKKKFDRPRLRKEDISTPVNFVHVQHVGFGPKNNKSRSGSVSACTSPTLQNDPFFDLSHRLSDSSLCGQMPLGPQGKENRFSHSYGPMRPNQVPPKPPPHGSMSNLLIKGQRDSLGFTNFSSSQNNKLQPLKNSFSGSLLNLSFLNFGKSGNDRSKNEPSKSKRMSLGPQMASSILFTVPSSPPPEIPRSPPPPINSVRTNFIRRRSSSFAGEMDFNFNTQETLEDTQSCPKRGNMLGGLIGTNSALTTWIKKPKISKTFSQLTPPMSPSYDELPPPPSDLMFSSCPNPLALPESPSYDELLPPPPSPAVLRRKESLSSPPIISKDQNGNPWIAPDKPLPLSPPRQPKNLLIDDVQVIKDSKGTGKMPLWRAKVVRVNAPTLPPLSVPLLRVSNGELLTPPSWPLEPEMPDMNYDSVTSEDNQTPPPSDESTKDNFEQPVPQPLSAMSLLEPLPVQGVGAKLKKVEREHVDPLSRLFQKRTNYQNWPVVMNQLLSPSSRGTDVKTAENSAISRIYGELVTKTLELWLELGDGNGTFEDVICAFEHAQNKIDKDCQEKEKSHRK